MDPIFTAAALGTHSSFVQYLGSSVRTHLEVLGEEEKISLETHQTNFKIAFKKFENEQSKYNEVAEEIAASQKNRKCQN